MDLGDSRGRSLEKSLEEVSKTVGSPKSEKNRQKGPKHLQKSIFRRSFGIFWTLFEIFLGVLGPGPGRLFRDFLAFGPEAPSPRSTEPQVELPHQSEVESRIRD